MKKLFLVALSATLLAASCQKTEIINPSEGMEMTFSPKMGKLTKASDSGETNLQQQGFLVTAINAYEDIYTSDPEFGEIYDGINNTQFTYENGAWGTQLQYYWPGTDKDLVFLAISSQKENNKVPDVTITGDENEETGLYTGVSINSYVIENFVVDAPASDAGPNNDLMIADAVKQNQGQNSKVVDLKFRHTLSKVEFLFVTNGQNGGTTQPEYPKLVLSVDKANVNVSEEATFTVTYFTNAEQYEVVTDNATITDGANAITNAKFASQTEGSYTFTASYTIENQTYISNEVVVVVGEASNAFPKRFANETINVTVNSIKVQNIVSTGNLTVTPTWTEGQLTSDYIPNAVDGKIATFNWTPSIVEDDKKTYTVERADFTLTTEEKTYATWLVIPQAISELKVEIAYKINDRAFTSIFPLYTTSLTNWGVNQYIKYKINLSPNLITFNPDVIEWDTPTDVNHNN